MVLPDRVVMEEVQGKEIALCHIISNLPLPLREMLDIDGQSIGIFSVTPSEAAYIAADHITHAAPVKLVFVDRYLGSVLVTGSASALEAGMRAAIALLCDKLGFPPTAVTRS